MSRIPECFKPVVIKDFAQLPQAVEVAAQRHEEAKGRIQDLMKPIFESVPSLFPLALALDVFDRTLPDPSPPPVNAGYYWTLS